MDPPKMPVQPPDECTSVTCVTQLPATLHGTTAGASHHGFDHYSCPGSDALTGTEVVYRFTLPTDGLLFVSKSADSAPGTVVRLLGTDDPQSCLDGHSTNVAATLAAGNVYVAVDSPAGAEGAFTLQAALITPGTFTAAGVSAPLASDALTAFEHGWAWGATRRSELVMVDFSLHSAMKREWVFDLSTGELLWNLRVAHGRKSTNEVDLAHAIQFSNVNGSNESSLGLFRSAGTYIGEFGASFRLEGLEPGFNDNACDRAIVMHPWAVVGDEYVNRCGWVRPSLGCPAIDSSLSQPVRDRLARPHGVELDQGVLMFYWFPGTEWQAQSAYLHGTEATPALKTAMSTECDSSTNTTPIQYSSTDYACD
jgi:hypothetical protein